MKIIRLSLALWGCSWGCRVDGGEKESGERGRIRPDEKCLGNVRDAEIRSEKQNTAKSTASS